MILQDDLRHYLPRKSKYNCLHCKGLQWQFEFRSSLRTYHFADICARCRIVMWAHFETRKLSEKNAIILIAAEKEASWNSPRIIQEAK